MKKIIKEPTQYHTYALESDYDNTLVNYCQYLKTVFGWQEFQWDHGEKKWRFKDPGVAIMLKDKFEEIEITEEVRSDIKDHVELAKKEQIQTENAIAIRQAKTSNLEIKGIKGKLYEYQKQTVEWLINNQGRGLLSLDMGLGKTLCSLSYIVNAEKKKTLVICPVSIKYVWYEEIKKWTNLVPFVIDAKSKFGLEEYKNSDIIIINFDILKKFFTFLTSVKLDCLIVDESTYIKNPRCIRTKAVRIIAQDIKSVILLSGSPLLNRIIEIFTSLNILDPRVWNNYFHFAHQYCGACQTRWGLDVAGSSNLPELREKINNLIIRIKKEDVLKELPQKKFIDIPIKLESNVQKKYNLLESSFVTYLKEIKKKTKREIQKALLGETLVKLNELRILATEGKIKFARELIEDIIATGAKMVVFSSFNSPLKQLQELFMEESVLLVGSTPSKERQKIITEFQNNPDKKIFLGGMRSANMGITLTSASVVLFIDMDYTPENMKQAYCRIDRIGQKADSISIYQIIAMNTIDQRMTKILKNKQQIIDQLIDGKDVVDKKKTDEITIINDLIDSYCPL